MSVDPAQDPSAHIIGKITYQIGPVQLPFPSEWTPQGILDEVKQSFQKQAEMQGQYEAARKVHAFLAEPCAAAVFMLAADAIAERDEIIGRQSRMIADLERRMKTLESQVLEDGRDHE